MISKGRLISAIKILGFSFFLFILINLEWSKILAALRDISVLPLLACPFFFAIAFFLKGLRWQIIQASAGIRIGLWDIQRINIETLLVSYASPGRAGEMLKVWIINERFQIPKSKGFAVFIFDRLFDLSALMILCVFALASISSRHAWVAWLLPLVCLGVLIIIFAPKLCKLIPGRSLLPKVLQVLMTEFSALDISIAHTAKITFVAVASLLISSVQAYLIAYAMGLNIPYLDIASAGALSSLFGLIPLSISGFGLREAGYVVAFGQTYSWESLAVLSMLDNYFLSYIEILLLVVVAKLFLGGTDLRQIATKYRADSEAHAIGNESPQTAD